MSNKISQDFTLAYYASDRKTGQITVVESRGGDITSRALPVAAESGLDKALKPVLVGLTGDRRVIELDPRSKEISVSDALTADAFAAHNYPDPGAPRDWLMNDGDKETGNDTLNCGDRGSSVTVIENTASADAKFLKTICVGRGHHQANFSYPSAQHPDVPKQAYISNLKDGTLSVIGNDPDNGDDYLNVVATINLAEPDREEGMNEATVPNNAFPHGLVYSGVSGKIYNLNNGYGTIAVIDPRSHRIEQRLPFKGHSNLLVTPDGRYVIGRGADRKSDPAHVVAKLTVLDVTSHEIVDSADLQDIYISKYFFNAEGTKLYLTTGSSGSDEQKANLKEDALLIFDLTALPKIRLARELRLGASSGSVTFHAVDGRTELVFSSNSGDGTLAVIDAASDEIIDTLRVTDGASHSRVWMVR